MVSTTQMRELLESSITKNEWHNLSDIQHFIEIHFELDELDNKPHKKDENNYPRWKVKLNSVLNKLGAKGMVKYRKGISAKNSKDGLKVESKFYFVE